MTTPVAKIEPWPEEISTLRQAAATLLVSLAHFDAEHFPPGFDVVRYGIAALKHAIYRYDRWCERALEPAAATEGCATCKGTRWVAFGTLGIAERACPDCNSLAAFPKVAPSVAAEVHEPGHPHLIGGEFQSDKYPTCPRGKVPLSCKDKTAQPYLWAYAQVHRAVDPQFSDDLELALRRHGYKPPSQDTSCWCSEYVSSGLPCAPGTCPNNPENYPVAPGPRRASDIGQNPNCSGSRCWSSTGEVRILPTGGSSNAILCRACYEHEIAWRRDSNRMLAKDMAFAVPEWSELEVYRG